MKSSVTEGKASATAPANMSIGNGGTLIVPQGGRDSSSLKVASNMEMAGKIGGGTGNLSDTLGKGK